MSHKSLLNELKTWKELGLLRSIDYHFAAFIDSLGANNLTVLSCAFCSEYLGVGHVCLPLDNIVGLLQQKCAQTECSLQLFCQQHDIECLLQNSSETHAKLQASLCIEYGGDVAPLLLCNNSLYLSRYGNYEELICDKLLNAPKINIPEDLKPQLDHLFSINYHYIWQAWSKDKTQSLPLLCEKYLDTLVDAPLDWGGIEKVFLQADNGADLQALSALISDEHRCDWQKVSVALAFTSARCVISGGPGTGKTTTVTKLLALMLNAQPDLQIKMVAPTGKAAARLTESISNALVDLNVEKALKDKIPTQADTIHRLLGAIQNSNHFRHNASQPLNLDLLLVDEASMVDLPLMAKLLMALPDKARLILLGDKDQLASVEAGSVLGDICTFITQCYSKKKSQQLAQITGFTCLAQVDNTSHSKMSDNLCLLRKSYRFDQYSGIGFLAKTINNGKVSIKKLTDLCKQYDDLSYFLNNEIGLKKLSEMLLDEYRVYLESIVIISKDNRDVVKALLTKFNQFKILCAIREGHWGVTRLNHLAQNVLSQAGLIQVDKTHYQHANEINTRCWYVGRPVMITKNSYHLGLYNGDIGLCLKDQDQQLRVYFQKADSSIVDFLPSRLPSHETVFAMTVHKSQGSEFSHTVLALPQHQVPVVTRELIYTGITRAKNKLTLFADLNMLRKAVSQKTVRYSGLVERLKRG